MKIKITRQTLPRMVCSFCATYFGCSVPTKTETSKICDKFELRDVFFCDKKSCQLDVVVCVARQKRGNQGCNRCPKGKMLIEYLKLTKGE